MVAQPGTEGDEGSSGCLLGGDVIYSGLDSASSPNSCQLRTSEWDLIWKQGLCRCDKVRIKMRSY